ncbi:hypothetical protein [Xanthomonas sp. 1678]|uniref:hypothetical protein n=1 Tax=Xanthomonas sp. 1678 TaxID=3158788 RepID=UPI002861AB0E|nr:hypothetical protein [Xanthomonas translucens]
MPFGPVGPSPARPILNVLPQRPPYSGQSPDDGRTQATVCPPADTGQFKKSFKNKGLDLAQDLLCSPAPGSAQANNEQMLNEKKKQQKVLAAPD